MDFIISDDVPGQVCLRGIERTHIGRLDRFGRELRQV